MPAAAVLMLYAGCAQVVRPTGGASDRKAPEVVKFIPENKSLQFKGKSFSILFNEYFVVKDPNKQWIISPPLKQTPEYKIKGKMLTITFEDTLKENTTYNFNFGKSIADVNESNELIGLNYIFSTGTFIDSLQLTGTVSYAQNNAKEKEVLILLYELNRCKTDSFPYKILPDYFALSDAAGNYRLNYIKPGEYKAIALKDANSNFLFDNFEEAIAMHDSVIILKSNKTLDFKIFKEIDQKTYVRNKATSEYGTFSFYLNKPLPGLTLQALHLAKQPDWAYIETSKSKDSATIYLRDFSIDTIKLALLNNKVAFDTVEFAVLPLEKYTSKSKKRINPRSVVKVIPANAGEKDLNTPVTIIVNRPVEVINEDSILFFEGFFEGRKKLPFKLLKKDSLGKKFELETNLKNDSNYSLTILPGAFKDCFGYKNDTVRSNFKVPSIETVGNLYLTISADSTSGIIDFKAQQLLLQLLNEKGDLLHTQVLTNYSTVSFLNFKPGVYKAQIVIDENKNKQWDTGNFLKKQQAEKIIFMNTSMNLRANWDLEEEWKFSLKTQ